MAAESATARLERLLAMVPWLLRRQGVDLEEAARTFGVSPTTLERDLSLVFMCGLPGRMPDDLIDAQWDDGHVYLRNAETIGRPLRLAPDEALALVAGLRALQATPGLTEEDRARVAGLVARIEGAAGDLQALASAAVVAETPAAPDERLAAELRRAVEDQRQLALRHRASGRAEVTQRTVSPMRVVTVDGNTYLEAWCHRAEEVRLFRLDRIESAVVTPEAAAVPSRAEPRDLSAGVYGGGPDDRVVVLDLAPEAAWVAEYYGGEPVEGGPEAPGAPCTTAPGWQRVTVRAADPAWVAPLVWSTGGAVRVVSPADLASRVCEGASEAVHRVLSGPGFTVE